MRILTTAWLCILMVAGGAVAQQAAETPPDRGLLTGRIFMEGKPMPGGIISLFNANTGTLPDQGSSRQVPEVLARIDQTGLFRVMLPPGSYFLGAITRKDRGRKGPPEPDEEFFFARDGEGKLRSFAIVAGKTTEAGILSGDQPESFPEIAEAFTVKGTIYDELGKPFGGALILVRGSLNVPKPLFVTPRTGPDGKYEIKLPAGRSFYLVVRKNLIDVGRPAPGDFVGAYGGTAPLTGNSPAVFSGGKPVTGKVGEVLTGMDVTMYKIPDPEELKKKYQDQTTAPMVGGIGVDQPLPASRKEAGRP